MNKERIAKPGRKTNRYTMELAKKLGFLYRPEAGTPVEYYHKTSDVTYTTKQFGIYYDHRLYRISPHILSDWLRDEFDIHIEVKRERYFNTNWLYYCDSGNPRVLHDYYLTHCECLEENICRKMEELISKKRLSNTNP